MSNQNSSHRIIALRENYGDKDQIYSSGSNSKVRVNSPTKSNTLVPPPAQVNSDTEILFQNDDYKENGMSEERRLTQRMILPNRDDWLREQSALAGNAPPPPPPEAKPMVKKHVEEAGFRVERRWRPPLRKTSRSDDKYFSKIIPKKEIVLSYDTELAEYHRKHNMRPDYADSDYSGDTDSEPPGITEKPPKRKKAEAAAAAAAVAEAAASTEPVPVPVDAIPTKKSPKKARKDKIEQDSKFKNSAPLTMNKNDIRKKSITKKRGKVSMTQASTDTIFSYSVSAEKLQAELRKLEQESWSETEVLTVRRTSRSRRRISIESETSEPEPRERPKHCYVDPGEKDFILLNVLQAIRKPPKIVLPKVVYHHKGHAKDLAATGLARQYVYSENFGKVPDYICKIKQKLQCENSVTKYMLDRRGFKSNNPDEIQMDKAGLLAMQKVRSSTIQKGPLSLDPASLCLIPCSESHGCPNTNMDHPSGCICSKTHYHISDKFQNPECTDKTMVFRKKHHSKYPKPGLLSFAQDQRFPEPSPSINSESSNYTTETEPRPNVSFFQNSESSKSSY